MGAGGWIGILYNNFSTKTSNALRTQYISKWQKPASMKKDKLWEAKTVRSGAQRLAQQHWSKEVMPPYHLQSLSSIIQSCWDFKKSRSSCYPGTWSTKCKKRHRHQKNLMGIPREREVQKSNRRGVTVQAIINCKWVERLEWLIGVTLGLIE